MHVQSNCRKKGPIYLRSFHQYEVCPKGSWTIYSKVLVNRICLEFYEFYKVNPDGLNLVSKFRENCFTSYGVTLCKVGVVIAPRSTLTYCVTFTQKMVFKVFNS